MRAIRNRQLAALKTAYPDGLSFNALRNRARGANNLNRWQTPLLATGSAAITALTTRSRRSRLGCPAVTTSLPAPERRTPSQSRRDVLSPNCVTNPVGSPCLKGNGSVSQTSGALGRRSSAIEALVTNPGSQNARGGAGSRAQSRRQNIAAEVCASGRSAREPVCSDRRDRGGSQFMLPTLFPAVPSSCDSN